MSYRNTDETAFHILMPNLDESAAQNNIELLLLNEFKESYRIFEKCQYELQEVNSAIRDAQKSNSELLRCLREKAQRIAARLNLEDKTIVNLRNEPHLKNLYEREKAKALKKAESEKLEYLLSLLNR